MSTFHLGFSALYLGKKMLSCSDGRNAAGPSDLLPSGFSQQLTFSCQPWATSGTQSVLTEFTSPLLLEVKTVPSHVSVPSFPFVRTPNFLSVLGSFKSTWPKLSVKRRESQLRKCPHKIKLRANLQGIFLISA